MDGGVDGEEVEDPGDGERARVRPGEHEGIDVVQDILVGDALVWREVDSDIRTHWDAPKMSGVQNDL